jgi:hypothetical protein
MNIDEALAVTTERGEYRMRIMPVILLLTAPKREANERHAAE